MPTRYYYVFATIKVDGTPVAYHSKDFLYESFGLRYENRRSAQRAARKLAERAKRTGIDYVTYDVGEFEPSG